MADGSTRRSNPSSKVAVQADPPASRIRSRSKPVAAELKQSVDAVEEVLIVLYAVEQDRLQALVSLTSLTLAWLGGRPPDPFSGHQPMREIRAIRGTALR